jgi:hypothetical protein
MGLVKGVLAGPGEAVGGQVPVAPAPALQAPGPLPQAVAPGPAQGEGEAQGRVRGPVQKGPIGRKEEAVGQAQEGQAPAGEGQRGAFQGEGREAWGLGQNPGPQDGRTLLGAVGRALEEEDPPGPHPLLLHRLHPGSQALGGLEVVKGHVPGKEVLHGLPLDRPGGEPGHPDDRARLGPHQGRPQDEAGRKTHACLLEKLPTPHTFVCYLIAPPRSS